MATGMRSWSRFASAWALSVAAHGAICAVGALLVARSLSSPEAEVASGQTIAPALEVPVELELPVLVDDGTGALPAATVEPIAPPRGGGEAAPRPDTGEKGRGGTDTAEVPAVNLADRDDRALLSPEVRSRIDRSQVQRIASARERASREDWRASREPMELTFVASGRGSARPERRAKAARDPSAGARERGAPARPGTRLGAAALPPGAGVSPREVGGAAVGSDRASAGAGVRDGAPGKDHRSSAEVAFARPMVAEGTPSVPANEQGRPNDTVDSEQEVATAAPSIVHASAAGGAAGPGPGGQAGPGATGSGGVAGSGSSAKALGTGAGPTADNDAADRRRSLYMRHVMTKVYPLWANAFPKKAIAEGLQGTVVISFTIRADGSVANASVARPSGVPEFDENCRKAVLRGAPYAPLPPELGASFRWSMPFEAKNPAVRPKY
jgi:TonB family protein